MKDTKDKAKNTENTTQEGYVIRHNDWELVPMEEPLIKAFSDPEPKAFPQSHWGGYEKS